MEAEAERQVPILVRSQAFVELAGIIECAPTNEKTSKMATVVVHERQKKHPPRGRSALFWDRVLFLSKAHYALTVDHANFRVGLEHGHVNAVLMGATRRCRCRRPGTLRSTPGSLAGPRSLRLTCPVSPKAGCTAPRGSDGLPPRSRRVTRHQRR